MIDLYTIPAGIPAELDRDRPVVIIDIFRASTSMSAALAAGAEEIIVAGSIEEAAGIKQQYGDDLIMAGERGGFRIQGYDLGNSPREMTPDNVAGRKVLFNSTNGTRLLRRFDGFPHVVVGSFVCLSAVVAYLKGFAHDPVICCAGTEGKASNEDTLAGGMIVSRLDRADEELNDAAVSARRLIDCSENRWSEWAKQSFHGRYLASIGLAEDLAVCIAIDTYDFAPVAIEGKIRRVEPPFKLYKSV